MKYGLSCLISTLLSLSVLAQDPASRSFMITSHKPNAITIISNSGEIKWQFKAIKHPQDAQVLEDGTIFCSEIPGAKHIGIDKQVIWQYQVPQGCQNPVAQVLPNGRFLVGNEGPCKLLELERGGKIALEVQLTTPSKRNHGQFRFCRKTSKGTYLTPLTADGLTREWSSDGKMIREFPKLKTPVGAIRLPNGNTLIGARGLLNEYDGEAQLIWSISAKDIAAAKLGFVTGLIRLRNGNTIIGNYTGDDTAPDIIEISQDKKVVWSLAIKGITKVAMVQLLNSNGKPSKDVLAR